MALICCVVILICGYNISSYMLKASVVILCWLTYVVCVKSISNACNDEVLLQSLVISRGKGNMVANKPQCTITSKYLAPTGHILPILSNCEGKHPHVVFTVLHLVFRIDLSRNIRVRNFLSLNLWQLYLYLN